MKKMFNYKCKKYGASKTISRHPDNTIKDEDKSVPCRCGFIMDLIQKGR